ncbi:hypothetical protein H072_7011 [Dactylellina haptotyla CBS 200.50]|uniref:PPPDE domain-containing protein n=1 Tax=Dactylellina haptotyla (strain CBS 200.50) TaxID=1284197 RepID=S8ADN3_DACHA|nr:hypothetical protein H072_7011 [Dactylellina haptotyla CBS 200.50]
MATGEERLVQLYVYDLSKGLARTYSQALLGRQIDAVYHTSIVLDGVEIYYGAGIQRSYPGNTHHGAPEQILDLGYTALPADVVAEYLESMKEIYGPESYDLFMHNCNNFTDDFSTFLVGRGIPKHITSLPADVLSTPFGQMLRPTIDAAMRPITTAPSISEPPGRPTDPPAFIPSTSNGTAGASPPYAGVRVPQTLADYDRIMASAANKGAIVFFTSATCPPCRVVYPHFEQLAEESAGKIVFIKVDVSKSYDIGSKYQIRATPTFFTFIRGEKFDEWSGAHPGTLKANVNMLMTAAFPPHPHDTLRLPVFMSAASQPPVTYSRQLPLDKVLIKLGKVGTEGPVIAMKDFIVTKQKQGAIEARVPDLQKWSSFLQASFKELPLETLFPLVDIFRLSLTDPRISAYYAEERGHATIQALLETASSEKAIYQLRLVTLHAICNLFSTPLFPPHLIRAPLVALVIGLVTTCLLDESHSQLRVAAASLIFNLAAYNQKSRVESSATVADRIDALSDDDQIQLLATVVESVDREKESTEALRGLILSLGLIVYGAKVDGEVLELVGVLEAARIIDEKGKKSEKKLLGDDGARLCKEIGEELLVKGTRKP